MVRVALGIEYDGSAFAGWQAQTHASGIQTHVEEALHRVADHAVEVTAAGRTDAGVHASMQVAHFDTGADRTERAWVLGANTNLRAEISVLWARVVPEDFHARYSAQARSYRYLIRNRRVRLSLERERACWMRDPLDAEAMHAAGQLLLGEHDFSSFRAAECQAHSPKRCIEFIRVVRAGEYVAIDVTANAFLQHMVRNIAGVLTAVGTGKQPVAWVREVLDARDRRMGGVTAPAQGLYLAGVRYPAVLALPSAAPATAGLLPPFLGNGAA